MTNREPKRLKLGIRVYPDFTTKKRAPTEITKRQKRSRYMLVFDTETRTEATQELLFGSYRLYKDDSCVEEGLFHGDSVTASGLEILRKCISENRADTLNLRASKLQLLTRSQFCEKVFKAVYKGRAVLVAFNFPFDVSRLAVDFGAARGIFTGGFSFGLHSYCDKDGITKSDKYRPRICIKHINSKSALKGLAARICPDEEDLDTPDCPDPEDPDAKKHFRGHFVDAKTLGFALTDRGFTLEKMCSEFGVANGKAKTSRHGEITQEYINYNRQDVRATAELTFKLLEEYDRHPINLQETKAYSPASIGKAYLSVMGIKARLVLPT